MDFNLFTGLCNYHTNSRIFSVPSNYWQLLIYSVSMDFPVLTFIKIEPYIMWPLVYGFFYLAWYVQGLFVFAIIVNILTLKYFQKLYGLRCQVLWGDKKRNKTQPLPSSNVYASGAEGKLKKVCYVQVKCNRQENFLEEVTDELSWVLGARQVARVWCNGQV